MVEVTIIDALKAHAGLNALVGDRVWPMKLKERAALPAVTVQRILGGAPEDTHGESTALALARYQLACWGQTYKSALQVAGQVKACMRHYKSGDIRITFIDNTLDRHEEDTGLYARIVEVLAWVKE